MRDQLTTLGEIVGAAAITAGVWQWSPRVAWIVAGALLIVMSTAAAYADRAGR